MLFFPMKFMSQSYGIYNEVCMDKALDIMDIIMWC